MSEDKLGAMLLNVIDKANNKYFLLKELIKFCKELEQTATGEEKANTYEILRVLSNSINNAGWEERHSGQIDFINKEINKIVEDFEDFLP